MTRIYYTPPPDEQFEELRKAAIQLWSTMGDEPSYSEKKIGRIRDIQNVGDNFMYMVAMFDMYNQKTLAFAVSPETRKAVSDRMVDGGNPDEFNPFLQHL